MYIERIRAYLTREVALRFLASLALALILWALVTLREDPETSRAFADVPVESVALDDSLVLLDEIDPVRVELSGPESDINPIDANAVVATIDFSGVNEPGTYQLPIELDPPDGVWRSSVSPATATVQVERSATEELALVPTVLDLDANSLRSVTVVPDQETVLVTGPSSLVESVAEVVLPVEVSGGTQTFQDIYIPEARDAEGNLVEGVTIAPTAVEATVRVSARGKSVAVLASITGTPATGYEVGDRTINPQFVIVDGNEAILDSLVALTTDPIDVTGADASFNQTVGIADLPEGLQILQPSSGQVEVLVQITQRGVRQSLPSQQVTIVGVEPGLVASVNPDEVTIEVVAPQATLAELDSSTLQVVVDATSLAAGTYTVQPLAILPAGVQWVTTFPSEVTLTITELPTTSASGSPPVGTIESAP
ncbi:MAG: CdaR family protein [Thermomicrobiales bacterium]